MNIKTWEVAELNKERAAKIAETYGIPSFLAMLLDIRGIVSEEDIEQFLYADTSLSDPFLMKDMDKAVERIHRAVDNFEKIAVYGDYDADGVTSTSMIFTYLDTIGADVIYYIPKREGEGYGMNIGAVEHLHNEGVKLIITVDNGIASVDEVDRANELGIDVVVTDHHRPHEKLPNAYAVVDPYREDCNCPFKAFAGAGVALKLLIALEDGDADMILSEYADLAALGTIADVVPLKGENRAIIRIGLDSLITDPRPGVEALFNRCISCNNGERNITARSLAFTVIPRINATGRMGSSSRAVKLLTCDFLEEAEGIADEICKENEERKRIETEIAAEALEMIRADEKLRYDRVLVVEGKDWHHGVVGIVASRVTDHFGKPCMIISKSGELAKGSGRSVEGFSLFDAVTSCGDLCEKYGGHPMAAGITLKEENISEFRRRINEYARKTCYEMPAQKVKLDCKLNPVALTPQMPLDLEPLEPFGSENPQPVFGLYGMEIASITPVGAGAHLRLGLKRGGETVTCMKFGMTAEDFPFGEGCLIDVAATLETREYKNQPQLTISVKDMKLSDIEPEKIIHVYRSYESFKRGEELTQEQIDVLKPSRDDIAAVYRILKPQSGAKIGIQMILAQLKNIGMNLGKLLISVDILKERGLISAQIAGALIKADIIDTNGSKIDIYESPIFEHLVVQ